MPRAANPLLSLLSQPLGSDSDNEETSGQIYIDFAIALLYIAFCSRGDEEGGSQSIAGLLGSLMATRYVHIVQYLLSMKFVKLNYKHNDDDGCD